MEEFVRILAEEISAYYRKKDEDVGVDELIEDMDESIPELEALYNAAERWHDYKVSESEGMMDYYDTLNKGEDK